MLYVNSTCNMKCEHCYYWRSLNQPDNLTLDEYRSLAESLGEIENLNLFGGEPFIRDELAEVCRRFIRTNGVRRIYVPTNAYFTERMQRPIEGVLEESTLEDFVVELSLDGLAEPTTAFAYATVLLRRRWRRTRCSPS